MTRQPTDAHPSSQREEDHAEMLKKALARPGVREVMRVYATWQEKDKALDIYRLATKRAERIKTKDSSSQAAGGRTPSRT